MYQDPAPQFQGHADLSRQPARRHVSRETVNQASMGRNHKLLAGLAVMTLVSGLAACHTPDEEQSPDPSQAGPSASNQGGAPGASYWTNPPEGMPFERYYAAVQLATDAHVAAAEGLSTDWAVQQEDSIAACMKASGFGYFPMEDAGVAGGNPLTQPNHLLAVPKLSADEDQVTRFGYGVMAARKLPSAEGAPDPNGEYRDALSEAAKQSYDAALWGPEYAVHETGTGLDSPEIAGCTGATWEAFPDPAASLIEDSPLTTHGDLLGAMGQAIRVGMLQESELIALNDEWIACMRDQIDADLMVIGGVGVAGSPFAAMDLAIRTAADGTVASAEADPYTLPLDQRSLTGSQPEITIAVADYQCRVQTDYLSRYIEIQRAVEQRFVDSHKTELDQLLAELELH
ncbi:MAG: hypothetical protein LBH68_05820 [Bifidobacteriaceae bacterium]|jgi:hypothetical protein|nr:hypothetical protein [Bifidobacteriaceae bacterium]